MEKLAGKPVTFRVERKDRADETVEIAVQPSYRVTIGARMSMGEVAALRVDGPAARAGVRARAEDPATAGDRIAVVKLPEADGKQTWFAAGDVKDHQPNVTVRKLDPVLLPIELRDWADRNPGDRTVKLVVLRKVELKENEPVEVELTYDHSYRHDREMISLPNTPMPLSGLGLAYWVDAVVDAVEPGSPAAEAGLQRGDLITAVRFKSRDYDGTIKTGDWDEVKSHQWASADAAFQMRPPHEIDLKVKRGEAEIAVSRRRPRGHRAWPTEDRGLIFQQDFRTQKATDIVDALNLGGWRTVRFIKEVYMNLYAMIFGRVSAKTMSGPLTIANVSYRFAGRGLLAVPPLHRVDLGEPRGGELPADPGPRRRAHGLPHPGEDSGPPGSGEGLRVRHVSRAGDDPVAHDLRDHARHPAPVLRVVLVPLPRVRACTGSIQARRSQRWGASSPC